MFENLLSWLLFPLGVVLGLSLARKREAEPAGRSMHAMTPAAAIPEAAEDSAISALSRAIEGQPAAIELELTLGTLFRKRGELDRAIRLHESLLERPALPEAQAAAIKRELAQDFLRAGLMDRAESLLVELVERGGDLGPSLELLLEAYEQGRDWPAAMATAQRLQGVLGTSMAPRVAHHHCEQADAARARGDAAAAIKAAQQALDVDRDCARASLLLGAFAEAAKDWPAAIKAYQRVIPQDRRYLSEAIEPLARCYRETGEASAWYQFLSDTEADHPDSLAIALAKASSLRAGGREADDYLATRLAAKPDLRGLLIWLEGKPFEPAGTTMLEAYKKRLAARPRYRCSGCGLQPSVLFWQCPSCKRWATVAPTADPV